MRGLLAAGALVAILGWAGSSGGRPLHPVAPAVQAKHPVALVTAGRRTRLAPLDPARLRIGTRRSAPLGFVQAWAFDPGGKHAVIAAHARDDERSFDALKTVDLRSLRLGRRIVGLRGWAQALLWQRADRIVAVVSVCCSGGVEIDAVDPQTRSVVSRTPIRGGVAAIGRSRVGLVLFVVPQNRIGPARLVVAGVDGSARGVELPDITAGWTSPSDPTTDPIGTQRVPGLAVDPTGDRAYSSSRAARPRRSTSVRSPSRTTISTRRNRHSTVWLRGCSRPQRPKESTAPLGLRAGSVTACSR